MGAPAIQSTSVVLQEPIAPCLTADAEPKTEQLSSFFELSADLFCITGFDGYFRALNQSWEESLGFAREALLKTRWLELVHPEDRELSLAETSRIIKSASSVSLENRYRRKDGSYRSFVWNAKSFPDQRLIYAVGRDITGRKHAEAALQHEQQERSTQERNEELARNNAIMLGEIGRCRQMEKSLLETQEKYRSIFENAVEGIFQSTPDGTYISVNPALARIKGYDSPAELIVAVGDIGRQSYVDAQRRLEFKSQLEEHGVVNGFEYEVFRKDGKRVWLSTNARAVRDSHGSVIYYEGTVEDITQRKRLEEQLRLVHKMEAVGQLAGGIAHDFNNLLGVILGHGELLLEKLDETSPLRNHAEQINRASTSGSALIAQLLAFSRQQVLQPVVLDLNTVVRNVTKMLGSVIGENIAITTSLDPELGSIKADAGQMEQVLVNLLVNARDAMPDGGMLRIETANVRGQDTSSSCDSEPAGPLVSLTVSDTGTGMDSETRSHIFEPFFTTKVRGKGTGLGLATVYGVVKQSGGSICVCSEPDHGTTFTLFFPRASNANPAIHQVASVEDASQGSETILLVEDDTALREIILTFLTNRGYTVLEAANGPQAQSVANRFRNPIHLLLSDVVMPGMGGPQMARHLKSHHPEMKLLYMSGYSDFADSTQVQWQGKPLLQKPFTQQDLLRKVREILEA